MSQSTPTFRAIGILQRNPDKEVIENSQYGPEKMYRNTLNHPNLKDWKKNFKNKTTMLNFIEIYVH